MSDTRNPPHPLLSVKGLTVQTIPAGSKKTLLEKIDFSISHNEILVILGESGSGKTVLSRSLTRLFPEGHALSVEGEVVFRGKSVFAMGDGETGELRRRGIRYIFQEPIAAFNPRARIFSQMQNAAAGGPVPENEILQALADAGIGNGKEVLRSYPFQLSVGTAQRVMLAMMVLASPALLIADEPTSAVDVSMRFQLLDVLKSVQKKHGLALLLITHDLEIARRYADRIVVLCRGKVVERASNHAFFSNPLHPYSSLLVEADRQIHKLQTVPDLQGKEQPLPDTTEAACRFYGRCPKQEDRCRTVEPPMDVAGEGHEVLCHYWK